MVLLSFFKFLIIIVPCLLCVAFLTLLERKVLGIMGLRLGPSKVSLGGFLQPLGDAGKLMNKESNSLSNSSFIFYYASSFFMMFCSMILFSLLCVYPNMIMFKSSVLIFFFILGFNSFNSILSGWSTFSKFSLLGSLRTVSQLVSYEVVIYICLFFLLFLFWSFDLFRWMFFGLDMFFMFFPILLFFWFLASLAELNRSPYDFSEGESELVSGFNIEFGSSCFTLIFLAEYGYIFFFMYLTSYIFFLKLSYFFSLFFFFLVIWIRSVLPRHRFDKLMGLCWKILVPHGVFLFLLFYVYNF